MLFPFPHPTPPGGYFRSLETLATGPVRDKFGGGGGEEKGGPSFTSLTSFFMSRVNFVCEHGIRNEYTATGRGDKGIRVLTCAAWPRGRANE